VGWVIRDWWANGGFDADRLPLDHHAKRLHPIWILARIGLPP
jgi:hypothetical protein